MKVPMIPRKTWRLVNLSYILDESGVTIPMIRVYPVVSHWAALRETWRSCWMTGSAVTIIVWLARLTKVESRRMMVIRRRVWLLI